MNDVLLIGEDARERLRELRMTATSARDMELIELLDDLVVLVVGQEIELDALRTLSRVRRMN